VDTGTFAPLLFQQLGLVPETPTLIASAASR